MRYMIVLSHLMSKECKLGDESVARVQLAIKSFKTYHCSYLITSGWAYRSDCDTPISDVVKEYVLKHSDIDSKVIISAPYSRDTVGDAYFALKQPQFEGIEELVVVTSDYHVRRTKIIFEKFVNKKVRVVVLGAKTKNNNDHNTLDHEDRSIAAFEQTFCSINFDDKWSVYEALTTYHPFYSGDVYPKIEFEYGPKD